MRAAPVVGVVLWAGLASSGPGLGRGTAAQVGEAGPPAAPLEDAHGHPWWRHAVFYQIYTRSFADSDGDGIGDLNGVAARLDHLESLGADALWLTPFYPSPNVDFGYDISDHRAVDPEYNWRSVFGGPAWELDPATGQYYYHFFYKEQPDLNWRHPGVRQAMHDVARFWLDRGVAGFRVDAIDTLFEDPALTDNPVGEGLNWVGDPRMENVQNVGRPEVHDVARDLRKLVDRWAGSVLLGETGSAETVADLSRWYGEGHDEFHALEPFEALVARVCVEPCGRQARPRSEEVP